MGPGASIPPGSAVAGIGRRLASMLYEFLVAFVIAFFAGLAFHGASAVLLSGETRLLFQIYLFLVLGLYFVACWSRGGRTLAMQTWKIRVVRRDGAPLGVGLAALRYVLAWASLVLLGAGFLWAYFDPDGQFLHDRLAGTRIVTMSDAPVSN